jgi:hypothetical protein
MSEEKNAMNEQPAGTRAEPSAEAIAPAIVAIARAQLRLLDEAAGDRDALDDAAWLAKAIEYLAMFQAPEVWRA